MAEMRGVVTIVQESRFQLTDEGGVSHHFVLSAHALADPDQLAPLAKRQAKVRVRYKQAKGIIAFQADRIELLD